MSNGTQCGARFRKSIDQISDRAKRYRANTSECLPAGRRICEYCGSAQNVEVHHRDGDESNSRKRNLAWACRSCNVSIGIEMRRHGRGVLTRQFNPAKSLAQWVTAVLSMKGESSGMPKDAAIEMIRETPASARSKFAREIWRRRRKNPGAELLVLAANPSKIQAGKKMSLKNPNDEAGAGEMYQTFHGSSPEYVDDYQEPTPRPETLTELGDLLELRVKRTGGWKHGSLDLTGCGVKLACDPAGKQLYCIGGDQRLSRGELTNLGVDNSKKVLDLGECFYVAYRTRKSIVDGKLASYEHYLGEESGVRPRLVYDRRGPEGRLLFSGGAYRVEAPGIID